MDEMRAMGDKAVTVKVATSNREAVTGRGVAAARKKKKDKKNRKKMVKKLLAALGGAGGLAITVPQLAGQVYHNWLEKPIIKCGTQDNLLSFSTSGEYRGINLRIYPQIIIRYGDYVILTIHLKNYYDKEFLQFQEDGTCQTHICHQEYVDKLKEYLKTEIAEEVMRKDSGTEEEEIRQALTVNVSSIGGVAYVNKRGNRMKRYCMIETNGLVVYVEEDSEEIINRLYETELVTKILLMDIEKDQHVREIIQVVSDEIRKKNEKVR